MHTYDLEDFQNSRRTHTEFEIDDVSRCLGLQLLKHERDLNLIKTSELQEQSLIWC